MQHKFCTDDPERARAALILYAMYRSRDEGSPLNGLETWSRCKTFIRAACIRSATTAEFVDNFCHKAGIRSIRPAYLDEEDGAGGPELAARIIGDDRLLPIFERESVYVITLVRERLQREKSGEGENGEEG